MDPELDRLLNLEISDDEDDEIFPNEKIDKKANSNDDIRVSFDRDISNTPNLSKKKIYKKSLSERKMSNQIPDVGDYINYSPSDSEEENQQFPIVVNNYKNTYTKINKEIENYYKEDNSDSESEVEESINKSESLIFSSIRTSNINQRIMNSIKTIQFLIHDYYKVTSSLLINNENKINNKNIIFSKSITFALGKSKYVAISDISGAILFLDLERKSIEILKGLDLSSGFCTSLAFSYDLTFLYAGYLLGDIKIFDINSLIEIKCLGNIFLNPINSIIPYSNSDFLICDNINNVFNFSHSRSYLIYNNFDFKRLNIFGKNKIKNINCCEINAEYVYENENDVIGISCFENNEIILFQLIPEKKNLEVIYKNDDSKIISSFFNRKIYSHFKRIFFFIFSTIDLSIYEIIKKTQHSKNSYKTQLLKVIPLETQSAFIAQWLNDNTISVFLQGFKIIHIYNFPFISQKHNYSISKKDLMKIQTNLA